MDGQPSTEVGVLLGTNSPDSASQTSTDPIRWCKFARRLHHPVRIGFCFCAVPREIYVLSCPRLGACMEEGGFQDRTEGARGRRASVTSTYHGTSLNRK